MSKTSGPSPRPGATSHSCLAPPMLEHRDVAYVAGGRRGPRLRVRRAWGLSVVVLTCIVSCGLSVRDDEPGRCQHGDCPLPPPEDACASDDDCVLAAPASPCCSCPEAIGTQRYMTDSCWLARGRPPQPSCFPSGAACDAACLPCDDRDVARCVAGICVRERCELDAVCNGSCTTLDTDFNCGGCGYGCHDGSHCRNGTCS